MPARPGVGDAGLGQGDAAGQPQLRRHQIDAPHLFGDGVLDLQARIGFDEEVFVVVDQELEGAQAAVFHGLGHGDGSGNDLLGDRRREVGAGRHFDDLLAAPLQGALALAQGDDAAFAVADDLDLDVARAADQTLGVEVAVAERRLGLGASAREGVGDLAFALDQAHAAPAATGNGFQRNAGLRVLLEEGRGARQIGDIGAGQNRHLALPRMGTGSRLVAEQFELLGRRADEGDLRGSAGRGEIGVLRQEAIAWMHRITARLPGGGDHRSDIEIGGGALALERDGLVDAPDMQGRGVVVGVQAGGGDAELGSGLGDADGDLAAIGDQEFFEHVDA